MKPAWLGQKPDKSCVIRALCHFLYLWLIRSCSWWSKPLKFSTALYLAQGNVPIWNKLCLGYIFLTNPVQFPVRRLHWGSRQQGLLNYWQGCRRAQSALGSTDWQRVPQKFESTPVFWAVSHNCAKDMGRASSFSGKSCLWTPAWWNSRQQWPFAFGNSLSGFSLICSSHVAVDVPAPTPASLPPLAFGSHFIRLLMLNCGVKSLEEEEGLIEMTLENQELQLSSRVCRGRGMLQSRGELESVLYSRWVRKTSAAHRGTPETGLSLGNLSREFYVLGTAMIHALYYVSQHTTTPLKALPFSCYLISVIRGQWIEAKVLPQHISKQEPHTLWQRLFQRKCALGFASHIA